VLDLFAGSGALSLEALSRGAEFAVLNDINRNAYTVQKENIVLLHYEARTRQLCSDWKAAVSLMQKEQETFDIIFLDPPYAMLDLTDIFTALIPLIRSDSIIILEHEAGKQSTVADGFRAAKNRSWGFCAVTIFQYSV